MFDRSCPAKSLEDNDLSVRLHTTGLIASPAVNGPVNGPIFLAYVRQQLMPSLKRGDVVIMDNLAAHKVPGVQLAMEAVGARVTVICRRAIQT